jgi:ketosteroid isomerase-like protein
MTKKIVTVFTILIMTGLQSFSQSKEEKAVAQAVESLRNAMVSADQNALNDLTDDALSYGHSSGKVEGKKDFVDNIASGKSDFVTIDLTSQTIQVTGKTAVVRHMLSATTNDGGKPGTVKLSILLIWQKQKDNWKLLARQAVKVI